MLPGCLMVGSAGFSFTPFFCAAFYRLLARFGFFFFLVVNQLDWCRRSAWDQVNPFHRFGGQMARDMRLGSVLSMYAVDLVFGEAVPTLVDGRPYDRLYDRWDLGGIRL